MLERGIVSSRARAHALILSGHVFCGATRIQKPGSLVAFDADIELRKPDNPWVSRGGLKLDHALSAFDYNVEGLIAIDIGASTGGFTDVLLTRGVLKVYAVDVGYGQLAWRLRQDERVIVMERENARYLDTASFDEEIDLVVCDASFISLVQVLPAALSIAMSGAKLIALIKPQFEAGKDLVEKGGVVRKQDVHEKVCVKIRFWLENIMKWDVLGIEPSPIKGPAGNKEFFISAIKK